MKKHFLHSLWLVCVLLSFASCSQSSKSDMLLEQIPEQTDVVIIADVKKIFASAGGTIENGKITLPSVITDRLSGKDSRSVDEGLEILQNSGIDLDLCAFIVSDYDKPDPLIIVAVENRAKFVKTIEEEEYDETDEADNLKFYSKRTYQSTYDSDYDKYCYIAVGDKYAYIMPGVSARGDSKPVKQIARITQDAAKSSFASTAYADYIIGDDSAMGIAARMPRELRRELRQAGLPEAVADMYKGAWCARTKLGDDMATMRFRFFGENGKPVDFSILKGAVDLDARVSNKAISYLNADEFIIGAMAIKGVDWAAVTDAIGSQPGLPASYRMGMSVVRSYLENIDGTIAFGFGLTDGLRSVAKLDYSVDVMKQMAFTLVVETKPGRAKVMASDIASFIEQAGVSLKRGADNTFSISIPNTDGDIYVGGDDDILVISNRPVSSVNSNAAVKAFPFTDYLSAGVVYLPSENPLMKQLGISADVELSGISIMPDCESVLCMKITGGDAKGGILARLAEIIVSVSDAENTYTRLRSEVRETKYGTEPDSSLSAVEIAVAE